MRSFAAATDGAQRTTRYLTLRPTDSLAYTEVGARERTLGAAVTLVAVAAALGIVPFAHRFAGEVPSFAPAAAATISFAQLLTAFLLYNQYRATRHTPLAVLALAYAGSAALTIEYVVALSGQMTAARLFGSRNETPMWLYGAAHFFFIVYAGLYAAWEWAATRWAAFRRAHGLATVVGLALLFIGFLPSLLAHRASDLPPLARAGTYVHGSVVEIVPPLIALHVFVAALLILATRLRYSVHLWLAVVVVVSAFDILLSTVAGGARDSVGWYAGRLEWVVASALFLMVLLSSIYRILLALAANNSLLHTQAVSDELTGLLNRRGFNARLEEELRRIGRRGETLGVLIVDVDDFKRYNDTFGHIAGDAALRAVARVIRSTLRRAADCGCRIGGEEFAVLLPENDHEGALGVAERIRRGVERLGIVQGDGARHQVLSVSVGVAVTESGAPMGAGELTRRGDMALYTAKRNGRNCVRAWEVRPARSGESLRTG